MRLALLRRGFGGVAGGAAQSEGDRDGLDETAAGAVGGRRLCPPCPRRRRPCGRRAAAGARQAEIQAVGPTGDQPAEHEAAQTVNKRQSPLKYINGAKT